MTSSNQAPESELTTKAREVLAERLTAKEVFDLRTAAGTSASIPATYGVGRLETLGLVSVAGTIGAGGHRRDGAGRLRDRGGRRALIAATDLGRECHRLLSEVPRG